MAPLLVIGYGNTLRNDDGVGPYVAEAVAALGLTGVQAMPCALLTPELSEPVSQARTVVFVDAAVAAAEPIGFRKLAPAASSQIMAHAADPGTVLALARDVFGRAPEAWLMTIRADNLELGEKLSPRVLEAASLAVERIRGLAQSPASPGDPTDASG